ncbi:hypothetical protein BCY84_18225 [Trypanosoma cruzi cruzi]|nr:hypothetical protein BCY84_18225 [Trypanosoma cruzi cruzi]PWU99332.1 hypothetical protein C4B63_9g485 [Trypanosoma cruzi]
MRHWSPWRCVGAAAAATGALIHRRQFIADGLYDCRAGAVGKDDTSKYRLPLRRALHFVEKGRQLAGAVVEREGGGGEALPSNREGSLLHEDAARYAAYHCHHMLTSFRAERRQWTKLKEFSFNEFTRVMEYLFFAALLLHLTALYETADKYCEALIDVAMSCTIFLSKDADGLHHADMLRQGRSKSVDAKVAYLSNGEEFGARDEPWDSLHWAIVHFSHGVFAWGLLDHTELLFDMKRTMKPYSGMVRTFAKIICERLAGMTLSAEDLAFLSCLSTEEGAGKWLGTANIPAVSSTDVFARTDKNLVEATLHFAQQRRLQILPLMWMALLTRHSAIIGAPRCFQPVRHALLNAIPLFQEEAKADTALKLLAQCCYFPSSSLLKASSVEVGVLLSQMERHGVFSSSEFMLVELLQAWMRVEAPEELSPSVKSAYGAYMAFRNIPRCALRVVGKPYTAKSDGEAFVHELLFHALVQWSSCLSVRAPFHREIEELLISARYVASLFDSIRQHRKDRDSVGAAVLVVEATFRAFAVRVADICIRGRLVESMSLSDLAEFDRLVDHVLREGTEGSVGGCVPQLYEENRQLWIYSTRRNGS